MSVTEEASSWVTSLSASTVPAEVDAAARRCILDGLGTALAASAVSLGEAAVGLAVGAAGSGTCTVIGSRARTDAKTAALANGWLVNALDWDDTYLPAVVHSTCNVLPAALAVAQEADRSVSDLVTAMIAGTELTLALSVALRNQTFQRDYSTSGTLGPFGAACAAATAEGLGAEAVADALGIAGTLVGGLMQSVAEGCSVKGLGPGQSAFQGVLSAQLAAAGVTGPREIVEGRLGLVATYFRDTETDVAGLGTGLGAPWRLPGVELKRHPGAHRAHAYVDTALRLVRDAGVGVELISRITCICSRQVDYFNLTESGRRPPNRYLARFSLPYLVAVALLHGSLTERDFDDEHRADARVLDLADRVGHRVDEARPEAALLGEVEIELSDGTRLVGTPAPQPATISAEFAPRKFLTNATPVLGDTAAEWVLHAILEGRDISVRELCGFLTPPN
jgi:2-methylcitrate dehydratase PrpD